MFINVYWNILYNSKICKQLVFINRMDKLPHIDDIQYWKVVNMNEWHLYNSILRDLKNKTLHAKRQVEKWGAVSYFIHVKHKS